MFLIFPNTDISLEITSLFIFAGKFLTVTTFSQVTYDKNMPLLLTPPSLVPPTLWEFLSKLSIAPGFSATLVLKSRGPEVCKINS